MFDSLMENILEKFQIEVNERIVEVNTGEILKDVATSGKTRDWGGKKAMNLQMADLYEQALSVDESIISRSRLQQMRDCASYLVFGNVEGRKKLVDANFCRMRLCPMCNWRKSLKMFSQVSEITDVILEEKPNVRFIFLTLTVKNPSAEELQNTLERMNEGFKWLVQDSKNFALAKCLKANLLGYLKATEITYNSENNTYHPHFHVLLEVRPSYFGKGYVKQLEYVQMWKSALKLDYDPKVDVRVVKNATSRTIAEMSKYPTKTADLLKLNDLRQAVEALIVLHKTMRNRRLITFGGEFKAVRARLKLDDIENGSLVHTEVKTTGLNNVAYTMFRYNSSCGCYIC
jgi:plasmid rolling circle replication initiator protein Rep